VTGRVLLVVPGSLRRAPFGRALWPVRLRAAHRARTEAAVTVEASARAPAVAAHAAV
jgi:hypothetical protein